MRVVALPGVFRPISDSWQLASAARARVSAGTRALEIGTGSGAVATCLALDGADVTVVDVSRRALLSAWLTARVNGVRVRPRRGCLFGPVAGERFQVIVSNPPYVPSEGPLPARGPERAWEAGPDGRDFLDRIIDGARAHLLPGGSLVVVHSTLNGEALTLQRMRAAALSPTVIARHQGPLGPLMRERFGGSIDREEVLIIEGRLASSRDDRPRRTHDPARRRTRAGVGRGDH